MKSDQTIKVVKRNSPGGDTEAEVPERTRKTEKSSRRDIGSIVRNWISERRENSRVERAFSDNTISSWKEQSESQENTTD